MTADRPLRSEDDLLEIFHANERPKAQWRIGAESEKFGVIAETGEPLAYERAASSGASIEALFHELARQHGYDVYREQEGGPVVALTRGSLSITLEPAAQLELSGSPQRSLHGVMAEILDHFAELQPISSTHGIAWLAVGFHPTARSHELPWVPKLRYPIMREYLPKGGARALDMMQRTATVQANFDFASEEDALRKLRVCLKLAPVIHTMTANSPFIEGVVSERKSERGDVWLNMPKDRSGLIPPLWRSGKLGYRDYAQWALDAGMFLFKRDEQVFRNTGQTFRSFLRDGFQGERAQHSDWALHLNTLFPEARLKTTLEARSCDCLNVDLMGSVPALYTGLLYDDGVLAEAEALTEKLSLDEVERARPSLLTEGLSGLIGGTRVQELAERVLSLAERGLKQRAERDAGGADETCYLQPLIKLVARGMTPADALLNGLRVGEPVDIRELHRRTQLSLE